MKIGILGFAREGKSILRFIQKNPSYKKAEIWVLDRSEKTIIPKNIPHVLGEKYLDNIHEFDILFRSPGIPYEHPQLKKARKKGVKIESATKLFFKLSPTKNIIGITGTKGKTTVSTLAYKVLRGSRKNTFLGGNVGIPMLELLPKLDKNSWVVLELSSFQLQDLDVSPKIGVILDIFPDHQDVHRSLGEYYKAKQNILKFQKKSDYSFFFSDNPNSSRLGKIGSGKKVGVNPKSFSLFKEADLKMRGYHAYRNAVMVAKIAEKIKIEKTITRKIITEFKGVEHRLEHVRTIKEGGGGLVLEFINDSASTNPHTAAQAIVSLKKIPHILIAGGHDKNLSYAPLQKALSRSKQTIAVVLMGENRKKIQEQIQKAQPKVDFAENLREAVQKSLFHAQKNLKERGIILFSPGAASFDMFQNYAERGNLFKEAVRKIGKS